MQTVWSRINTALLVLVLLVLAGALVKGVYGGPMDPPAPPGPTLPQVEPRIPISQPAPGGFPIVISQPGSYFLTQNITGESGQDGIQITTSGVTLDLNGFTVAGVPESLKGVHVTCSAACALIEIRGGNVATWGGDGIDMGLGTGQITDLWVRANAGSGVVMSMGFVRNNIVAWNGGSGIVGGKLLVQGNRAYYNGADGVLLAGAPSGNITDNDASYNTGRGIAVSSTGVLVAKNVAAFNGGASYDIGPGNDAGPIGSRRDLHQPVGQHQSLISGYPAPNSLSQRRVTT